MADTKPWEVDYEEPETQKPWELEYEKPSGAATVPPWLLPGRQAINSLAPALPGPEPTPFVGTIGPIPNRPSPLQAKLAQIQRGEPVTPQPGEVIEEPLGEYRREHPQTPLEALQMETKMPVPKMSEETGTRIARALNKIRAVPSTPEQDVAAGKLIAGGEQALAGLVDFMSSPGGIGTTLTGGVMAPEVAGARLSALAERSVATAFAADMARNLPEQTATIIDAIEKGDTKTATREILNATATLGVLKHAAKGAVTPLPEAAKPATPVAQPKETDASIKQAPAEVHGNVLPQPIEGEGQVPVKEGEPRVQPQTEGRIQEEKAVTPTVVDEPTGPGESARFTTKLPEGYATGFIKEGKAELVGIEVEKAARRQGVGERLLRNFSEKAQQSGATSITGDFVPAAKSLMDKVFGKPVSEAPVEDWPEGMGPVPIRAEYSIKAPTEGKEVLTPEAVDKMSGQELQSALGKRGHEVGIEYGETLTEKDVPKLQSKYDQTKTDMIDAIKSGNLEKQTKAFGENVYYGGALMGATRGKHPISGANYEMYLKRKGAETPATPAPEPTETVLAARHGTTHGLPPGVPDRGPTFPSELMEASRQLGALVRSRSTLRPGVLGQFVRSKLAGIRQSDRIEVGDIRNQATVSHEIGHSLDGILFPNQNFGDSQKSLADRVGTGTGKELSQELTKVSELMRGPMTGSAGHVAYRKRATELIADYFSLYAHDRDRAAALAPKFTKGFENALARDQNTADVVKGVVSGNVIPKPPDPTLKKALAGITGTPPQGAVPTPGKVPARPLLPPPARERMAAVAAEGLVKDAIRTFEARVQRARIRAENWMKRVPSEFDRYDVGAFIEGMRNLSKPGDTIDSVRTRMTPDKEWLVKQYRFQTELDRQEINSYLKGTEQGEYLKFLEDYLGHFYVDGSQKISAAASRFSKESPHAKQRKIPTLKEAVDMGLTPVTQDPAVLSQLTSRINWQVATNRKFVSKLKDIQTGGGQPVVVPKKDNPGNWPTTDNPLIQRVYARQTPSGLMLWRGGAAIHPDVWRAARQILEAPTAGDLGKAYDAINGFTRANAFAFSLFHDLTLRSAAIGSQATLANPFRGLFRVLEKHPVTGERKLISSTRGLGKELLQNEEAVSDAAEHGLKFSYTDSEAYQHNARTFLERQAAKWRDVPVLGKATRLSRDIQQWRQEGLWKNTHDAFKIISYNDLVSKALQDAPPGTDVKATKEQIASFLNDAYGGQEWQTKFWLDPNTRKIVSRFFLAPDWTLSTIRSVPGISDIASTVREQTPRIAGRESFPTPKEGLGGAGKRLRFWGAEVAALGMATAAGQYAIYKAFGDDSKGDKPLPWDNEVNQKMRMDVTPIMRRLPWHKQGDPTRYYVNLGKRPQEILNWFTEPDKQVMSKASRPVAMIFEQVTGSEGDFKAPWKQDHEAFIESLPSRVKAIGTEALPFTLRGNQFALSAPVRNGMTKYKAQQAYESIFELATEPNRIRSLLRGQQPSEGTILDMSSQVTDAAHRNGVNAEEVLVRSLSTVRGHHYNEFFKAFQKGDQKKMDQEAKALLILGATNKGIEESLKRRMELQPMEQ